MAIDLESYHFPCAIDELSDRDRAVMSLVVNGSDEQRAAIAGPNAADHADIACAVVAFVGSLCVPEPEEVFPSVLLRAQFLAAAAHNAVHDTFPDLHPEVVRRAGNLYALLNR